MRRTIMHTKSLTTLALIVAISLVLPVISTPYYGRYLWARTPAIPSARFYHVQNLPKSESETKSETKNDGLFASVGDFLNKYIRNKREDEWFNFGHKVVGPLSRFQQSPVPRTRWVGFFYEESMAIILISDANHLLECTLLELKKEEEQLEAIRVFGKMMELVPSSLQKQIELNRVCGEMPLNQGSTGRINDSSKGSLAVAPGTKWCGMGDSAAQYQELGDNQAIDRCCRTHDNCPMKVSALSTKYGVTNYSFTTRSHCLCEKELYLCLKKTNTTLANIGGNVYFNVLDLQCLHESKNNSDNFRSSIYTGNLLYQCHFLDRNNHCKHWKKNKINYDYEFISFGKSY